MKHQKAFSLVELIVVVAIIGVLLTVMMVSLGSGRQQTFADAATEQLASSLRYAKNKALSGSNTASKGGCRSHVTFVYGLETSSGGKKDAYKIISCTEEQFLLGGDVEFVTTGNFEFTTPYADVQPQGGIKEIVVRSQDAKSYVCVYSSGRIVQQQKTCL